MNDIYINDPDFPYAKIYQKEKCPHCKGEFYLYLEDFICKSFSKNYWDCPPPIRKIRVGIES